MPIKFALPAVIFSAVTRHAPHGRASGKAR